MHDFGAADALGGRKRRRIQWMDRPMDDVGVCRRQGVNKVALQGRAETTSAVPWCQHLVNDAIAAHPRVGLCAPRDDPRPFPAADGLEEQALR